jgi:hypothetical protein
MGRQDARVAGGLIELHDYGSGATDAVQFALVVDGLREFRIWHSRNESRPLLFALRIKGYG